METSTAHSGPGRPPSQRRAAVADAALQVLASDGARGLTHRAVDRAASLAEGSTSNYFRTREALLAAALHRHVELDTPPGADAAAPAGRTLSPAEVARLVVAMLDHILDPSRRHLLVARYELFLESTRRHALHDELNGARERFTGMAEALLEAGGCSQPRVHATQLVAALDGVLVDQLLAADSALDRPAIEGLVQRLVQSC